MRYGIRRVSDGQWWCGIPDDGKQGVWSRFPEDARKFDDAEKAFYRSRFDISAGQVEIVPLSRGAQTEAVAC